MTDAASILDSVRALAPAVREHADSIERERRLPEALVRGLIDAGVFRMLVPRSLGGEEIDPMSALPGMRGGRDARRGGGLVRDDRRL